MEVTVMVMATVTATTVMVTMVMVTMAIGIITLMATISAMVITTAGNGPPTAASTSATSIDQLIRDDKRNSLELRLGRVFSLMIAP
ncbi:hypothetical protein ACFIOY_20660 [Bradyrhizobium sp. TZ2]